MFVIVYANSNKIPLLFGYCGNISWYLMMDAMEMIWRFIIHQIFKPIE